VSARTRVSPVVRARRLAGSVLTAFALALGAAVLLPAAAGLQRYVVAGDSMTGTYDRGSLVYARVVPTAGLRVGDVITYRPPAGVGPRELVTHRIVAIGVRRDGRRVFRTRGDANPVADPWRFTLPAATQARVVFGVPYVGFALAALSDRTTRMLLIGLPSLAIALFVLLTLWREAGVEARTRARAGLAEAGDR
jgi:signal peptidase I